MVIGVSPSGIACRANHPLTAAAIGKEVWDGKGHGTPELANCLATLAFVALLGLVP